MAMSGELRYVRAPVPVRFPESELVPETKLRLRLRTLLFDFLTLAFAERATIGCDQFVYWDPTDPRACLAPDAFVRLGEPDHLFSSWKVWERGAPELAIEVISEDDQRDRNWQLKLERYRKLGVRELLRFESASPDRPLRIWDCIEGDLVERELTKRPAPSRVLPGHWLLVSEPDLGQVLRLSRDAVGLQLYPTSTERQLSAEARVRELEAELASRLEEPPHGPL
jgi:hypothetical protein